MLTLVELLAELKQLAASTEADKLARIQALFANPRAPAEFQVGRYYVARLLVPEVEAQLASFDTEQRKAAIATCRLVFPRNVSARLLRRVVKDPDPKVRTVARRAIRALGIADVAPPDIRFPVDSERRVGGYNPTGWAFGLFANDGARARKVTAPSRAQALATYGLPSLATPADVARLVGIDEADLARFMRPGTEAGSGYVEFEIPKAKGGTRRIAAPRTPLRKVQRAILDQIVGKVPVHDACHGFVADRSTVTNATPHRGAAIVVKLDLKDFFPTVHYRRVKGLFQHLGYNEEVSGTLAGLTTYRPKLASGHVA